MPVRQIFLEKKSKTKTLILSTGARNSSLSLALVGSQIEILGPVFDLGTDSCFKTQSFIKASQLHCIELVAVE